MAGWEELTPDQIMLIFYLVFSAIFIFSLTSLIKEVLRWRTMKTLKLQIETITKNGKEPSLFAQLRVWWAERKTRKEQKKKYKPLGFDR